MFADKIKRVFMDFVNLKVCSSKAAFLFAWCVPGCSLDATLDADLDGDRLHLHTYVHIESQKLLVKNI